MSATMEREKAELLARVKNMGTIEAVPIASMNFDKAYQRDLRTDFAKKLATNWSTTALGFPLVSRRSNGKLYVVNGQHRIAAATMNGLTEIVCLVISGLSEQEEADLRLAGNVHLSETSLETFRAKVAARYPEALDIMKIVEGYGAVINDSATKESGINCIATLESLYANDRGGILVEVLDVVRDAWGKVGGVYTTANILKAIAWMLEQHKDDANFNRSRFVEKLREVGLAALTTRMHTQRAAMGGSQWLNMYRGMVEVYNERLSEVNRLKWRQRGWSKQQSGSSWS